MSQNPFSEYESPVLESQLSPYYEAAKNYLTERQIRLARTKWLLKDQEYSFQDKFWSMFSKQLSKNVVTVSSTVLGFITSTDDSYVVFCPSVPQIHGLKWTITKAKSTEVIKKLLSKYYVFYDHSNGKLYDIDVAPQKK